MRLALARGGTGLVRRLGWLAAGAVVLGVLAVSSQAPGGLGPPAARAGLAAAAVGAAALLVRRRRRQGLERPALQVVARAALTREVGVALLEVQGCSRLIGYGPAGVQLLGAGLPTPPGPQGEVAP